MARSPLRLPSRLLVVAALALPFAFAAAPATLRADTVVPAALEPIDLMMRGFNEGKVEIVKRAFSVSPTIIDENPPYDYAGVDAVDRWYKTDMGGLAAAGGTHFHATRFHPTYFRRDGHLAYAVVPMTVTFTLKNVEQTERGGFVFALYEMEGLGWKIKSAAWYKIGDTTDPPIGAGLK